MGIFLALLEKSTQNLLNRQKLLDLNIKGHHGEDGNCCKHPSNQPRHPARLSMEACHPDKWFAMHPPDIGAVLQSAS
jgi:hypothetical protein